MRSSTRLGLGAYVVPFVLVFWGATFFFKTEGVKVGRLVIGLAIMLVAVMALLSLFSPGTIEALPYSLFSDEALVGGGGYVGSGISWGLMTLFGRIITAIILVGIFVAGLVIAGRLHLDALPRAQELPLAQEGGSCADPLPAHHLHGGTGAVCGRGGR